MTTQKSRTRFAVRRKIVLLAAGLAVFGASMTVAQSQNKIPLRVAYTGVITWLPAMIFFGLRTLK
ncbi:MAG TPA: hypothetical protein VH558_03710 [Pseudolabrys sp.]|jgi:hypothetical protein